MLQDLLECRRNGWRERRAKDGPHKLGTKASTTQGKGENQSRRDEERNLARERQRQAVSQQQQQQRRRLLSAKDVSSKSQDARQSRHSQASTVRILSRDQETTSSAHKSASDTYDTLWHGRQPRTLLSCGQMIARKIARDLRSTSLHSSRIKRN